MAAVPSHVGHQKSLFIFGLGYVGSEVAKQASQQQFKVIGTIQNGEQGNGRFLFDKGVRLSTEGEQALKESTHVLSTVPPNEDGTDPVLNMYKKHLSNKQWVGYCSSTGVYGHYSGELIHEKSQTAKGGINKMSAVTQRRHHIDRLHQIIRIQSPVVIFRIAGIYGPGRSALTQLRTNRVRHITKDEHVISRAHRDDIASGIVKSMLSPPKDSKIKIYNIADDSPVSQSSVIRYAASLLNIPVPPSVRYSDVKFPSDRLRSFYESCRRIDSSSIKSELGWIPRYPNYKVGLADCLKQDKQLEKQQTP